MKTIMGKETEVVIKGLICRDIWLIDHLYLGVR